MVRLRLPHDIGDADQEGEDGRDHGELQGYRQATHDLGDDPHEVVKVEHDRILSAGVMADAAITHVIYSSAL